MHSPRALVLHRKIYIKFLLLHSSTIWKFKIHFVLFYAKAGVQIKKKIFEKGFNPSESEPFRNLFQNKFKKRFESRSLNPSHSGSTRDFNPNPSDLRFIRIDISDWTGMNRIDFQLIYIKGTLAKVSEPVFRAYQNYSDSFRYLYPSQCESFRNNPKNVL